MTRRTDQLHQMRVFSAVAQEGNFAKAAIVMNLPASSVSKTIGQLEARLGAVLFRRTTRHMVLTDEGQNYLRMVRRVLQEIDVTEDRLRTGDEVRGTLHVTMPVAFSERFLSAQLPAFCKKYPDLMIDFDTDRRYLDLVSHNIDVAVRTLSPGQDSPFMAQELVPHVNFLVASPDYLAAAGTPRQFEDLARHRLIYFDWPRKLDKWQMMLGNKTVQVESQAVFRTNSYKTLNECALQGVGIANLPADYAITHLRSGALVHILPELKENRGRRVALYHQRRSESAKTDAFLRFLEEATDTHRAAVVAYLNDLGA
ncbi:LysR family transcriptional regulator [Maritalea myrionectae]|uniref:LysR family transcriptional regulator n=1 Tax=Maritalea myrionectae TaxID=454601 RepID=UPI000401C200|nr:LysR family transcriptional regulator [Maritalea myrionectae]